MAHYRMLDRVPAAVITSNRNELKLYDGNVVYLNNGDNFELRFFNPLPEKIGVEIIFNGIKKGDSYLVLNPGQDVILDRFIDEQRKMLFETYTIDGNNKDAVEAIAQNGIINFNFYKERKYVQPVYVTNYNYNYPTYGYPISGGTISGTSGTSGSAGGSGVSGSMGTNGGKKRLKKTTRTWASSPNYSDYIAENTSTNINYSEYIAENTNTSINYSEYLSEDMGFDCLDQNGMGRIIAPQPPPKPIETGRIEKGGASDQVLRTIDLQFDPTPFYTMTYMMMPHSARPSEITEIRQYCPECGYRLRKATWSFCPKCGEKL